MNTETTPVERLEGVVTTGLATVKCQVRTLLAASEAAESGLTDEIGYADLSGSLEALLHYVSDLDEQVQTFGMEQRREEQLKDKIRGILAKREGGRHEREISLG